MILRRILNYLKVKKADAVDCLICIYTCEEHRGFLQEFHNSNLGEYIQSLPSVKIIEVYANPNIKDSFINNNELILRGEESYKLLSLKTHKMMDYCVHNIDFKILIKIDVTVIMANMDDEKYKGRSPIEQDKIINFIDNLDVDKDYDGLFLIAKATKKGSEDWAVTKGGSIEYDKIFNAEPMTPFYSGKCYMVSRKFAEYISNNGEEMSKDHVKYLMGSEDVMIGRLYEKYQGPLVLG